MAVQVSPVLAAQGTYPFVRIERAKREATEAGIEIVDFGQGDPREPTDPLIRDALVDGLRDVMGYPKAEGLPELREAIAGWCGRRFGVELDPGTEVSPTYGSKEAIFSFAQLVLDRDGPKDTVVVTEPGYPVPGRGAAFAGARVEALPLLEHNAFLPALDRVENWDRIALFWVNYPNNPTGATAPLAFYERLADCRVGRLAGVALPEVEDLDSSLGGLALGALDPDEGIRPLGGQDGRERHGRTLAAHEGA